MPNIYSSNRKYIVSLSGSASGQLHHAYADKPEVGRLPHVGRQASVSQAKCRISTRRPFSNRIWWALVSSLFGHQQMGINLDSK